MNVVEFPRSVLLSPADMLRNIAAAIEAGEYGEVGCVAIALLADRLNVFSAGPDSAGPSAATVLNAGALQLTLAIVEHGQ